MRKSDFPIFLKHPDLLYFDTAATSQKPAVVIEAMTKFYREQYATVHRAIYKLAAESTALYDEARESLARFINAPSSDTIIFTRGTTEGINLIANTFIHEGDTVLISTLEHHSNIVPWQLRKADIKVAPITPSGDLDLEAFKKLLSSKPKLVSLAWIVNSIGTKQPIEEIIALSHQAGAKVLIDAAQAAAHESIDVQKLGVDFLVFSSHKCYGPTGIGLLYGKKELLDALPPWQGGGDMIETVTFEKTTFAPPPLRFEAGTPMIVEAIGFKAAVDYLNQIGLPAIKEHEEQLTDYALKSLRKVPGINLVGLPKQRGSIVSFTLDRGHPLDLATWLDLKGIALRSGHLCAQPVLAAFGHSSLLRLSFGLYNTSEEIDIILRHLEEGLKKIQ